MSEVEVEPEWLEALRRNSGLALDAEGRWRFASGFVENERVAEMFHRGVAVREDGEVTLTVGHMWAYVKCDGPAFFVRAVRSSSAEGRASGPVVELAGGREVGLEGATFGWGPDERLYLWVQGLNGVDGPALLLRTAHQALLAGLQDADESGEGEGLSLIVAGRSFEVVRIAQRPGPATPRPGLVKRDT